MTIGRRQETWAEKEETQTKKKTPASPQRIGTATATTTSATATAMTTTTIRKLMKVNTMTTGWPSAHRTEEAEELRTEASIQ